VDPRCISRSIVRVGSEENTHFPGIIDTKIVRQLCQQKDFRQKEKVKKKERGEKLIYKG